MNASIRSSRSCDNKNCSTPVNEKMLLEIATFVVYYALVMHQRSTDIDSYLLAVCAAEISQEKWTRPAFHQPSTFHFLPRQLLSGLFRIKSPLFLIHHFLLLPFPPPPPLSFNPQSLGFLLLLCLFQ